MDTPRETLLLMYEGMLTVRHFEDGAGLPIATGAGQFAATV